MRLLILSQYFWPENFIINDMVRVLAEQGHEVTVATGKPNYPEGVVFDGYRASGFQRECYLERIEVFRVPLWPRGKGGAKNLILNYLSFVFSGLLYLPWALRKKKFEAILVFAPSPITQTIPAIALKWLKKARLALWIQDLWPESLAATGFIKSPSVLKLTGSMVRAIYYFCDILLVQSRGFIAAVEQYADRHKIAYYPNSIDQRTLDDSAEIPEELSELLQRHFCVVFAGNLGTAQSLDTLVQAAYELREDSEIRLVLVGSGSRAAWLETKKQELQLDNLVLPGRFPGHVMPAIFKRASALLVSLTDEEIFSKTIPSKVQAYLAAGRPIIASLNGEGAQVVVDAMAGFSSPAGQVAPLVENIRRMKSLDEKDRLQLGRLGKLYFSKHFDMSRQCEALIGHLTKTLNK